MSEEKALYGNTLLEFSNRLLESQIPPDLDIDKHINDNFWDLIGDDETSRNSKNQEEPRSIRSNFEAEIKTEGIERLFDTSDKFYIPWLENKYLELKSLTEDMAENLSVSRKSIVRLYKEIDDDEILDEYLYTLLYLFKKIESTLKKFDKLKENK